MIIMRKRNKSRGEAPQTLLLKQTVPKEYAALDSVAYQRAMVIQSCTLDTARGSGWHLGSIRSVLDVQKNEPEVHLSSRVGIVQERSRT